VSLLRRTVRSSTVVRTTACSVSPAQARSRVRPLLALAALPLTRAGSPAHIGAGLTATALLTLAAFSS
jgi:hypothetical protein